MLFNVSLDCKICSKNEKMGQFLGQPLKKCLYEDHTQSLALSEGVFKNSENLADN
jgi:hypothetical protein